ncbi:MAG: dihydroorotase, partial [Anaerolineae bacterium]
MSEAQRLIRGCEVVTPGGVVPADILIQGEWIVAVAPGLSAPDVIDAHGLLAFPGAIDAHVHLREPGAEHKEDFTSGTRAALAGGVTTVLDMPNSPVATTSAAAWQAKADLAEAKACCDYGLYIGATPGNSEEAAGVEAAAGLKVYMGSSTGDLLVADLASQLRHFAIYPAGRVLAVHAEDEDAVRLFSDGEHRPPICAELAVGRAIALARRTGRRLHVCHVSTAAELDMLALAKRQGLAVTVEVSPHHLFLDRDDEKRLGALGIMNPPLRSADDVRALWLGLDSVDIVASDHAPHTLAEKQAPRPPSGVPGVETMLPLLLDAALSGRLSLMRVAELLASAPAALFQLPRKGRLAPGRHADIVLIDPAARSTVGERLYTRCGWTPFAGRELRGRIERV